MLAFSVLERGRRLTVRARAKVNLGLEVLSRRADGYHELLTLLSAVDLADRVTIEITNRERGAAPISLTCDAPGVPPGPDNLAWRAAEAMRREVGDAPPVRIHLAKAIPVAAGLGGGSADAAAVVAGLDRLWGVRLTGARRQALATGLGMDVPFFLGSGAALGTGRGERLAPAPALAPLPLVLVNPGFPLATRDVYGAAPASRLHRRPRGAGPGGGAGGAPARRRRPAGERPGGGRGPAVAGPRRGEGGAPRRRRARRGDVGKRADRGGRGGLACRGPTHRGGAGVLIRGGSG